MTSPAAFKGKTALVTGSSTGVGFRIAERLAEAGALVFINGRSAERGEQAADQRRIVIWRLVIPPLVRDKFF